MVRRRTREPSAARAGSQRKQRKPSAKQYESLITDRAKYLRSMVVKEKTFADKAAAQRFAAQAEKTAGVTYTVRGKKATFKTVNRSHVKASKDMKRILSDLSLKSNSARGRKAHALQELGRRETWYDFAVGDTNE